MRTVSFKKSRGFSLVATLSLLVLLLLVAVGLLSLSTITVRTSSQDAALAEARANARLGLMMALGQLQKHAGDDRRVSRAADQIPLDATGLETAAALGRRFWTGIYDSWEDGLKDRPEPQLRGWLVSNPDPASEDEEFPTSSGSLSRSVQLVGVNTAGELPEDWIEAPLLDLERTGRLSGRVAWWTGDEGLKAMIATSPVEEAKSLAEVRARLQAAPSLGVQVASTDAGQPFRDIDRSDHRLTALTDFPQASFLASDPRSPKQLFHDLATRTNGLLVNVREGGFRRDLSMEFERPEKDVRKDPLYTINDEQGINLEELYSFYNLHEALEPISGSYTTGGSVPSGTMGLVLGDGHLECLEDQYHHFKHPCIVSVQAVYSLKAQRVGPESNPTIRLYFVIDPIVTFWNPLDVPVEIPLRSFFTINYMQFPYTFTVKAGGKTYRCPLIASLSDATTSVRGDANYVVLRVGETEQLLFKPGEVIKVSQSNGLLLQNNRVDRNLVGRVGFNFASGVAHPMRDADGNYIDLSPGTTVTYTMAPNELTGGQRRGTGNSLFGQDYHSRHFGLTHHSFMVGRSDDGNRVGIGALGIGGIHIDYDFGNERVAPEVPRVRETPGTKPADERIYANNPKFADVFPSFDQSDTRPLSVAQLQSAKAPVMMHTFSVKTETTSETGTRALLRFNPKAHHVDFYDLSKSERDLLPYELVVEPLNSWVNRKLETSTAGNAYFGGGYDAADGNSFVTTHTVPREPIHSLGALQYSTANGFRFQRPQDGYFILNCREPMLPQVPHAIGNSFAPAVLAPDETSTTISGDRAVADHSYLANNALWDEWFFSSISPQETKDVSPKRSQREVAEQFLDGTTSLPIVHYHPDLGGRTASEALAELFSGEEPNSQATELMASLLQVEGMFNVNSTSVEAWRSLLASLSGEDIVTRTREGRLSRTEVTEGTPVAGLMAPIDAEAQGSGLVPVRDPEQWVGRRALSEEEITDLAEAIVQEVRRRGPFLSLADFVNRRVDTDPDLARAGTIQNALDSEAVRINEAYNEGDRAVTADVAKRLAFPEAEEGAAAAGIPGIVKQADLLTPLAPILSARSDTFLIRAYGEAVDAAGNITARAWCEAQVQRDAEYIDPADSREKRPDELTSSLNKSFGRRFKLISFRWLGPQEI